MTRDDVLAILKRENGYISGERMSVELGISRAAINSAVKLLRSDGYEIASSTNKGYSLIQSPDLLTRGELMTYLPEDRLSTVLCLDTADSTNRVLRDMACAGAPSGQIVIANEQTNGRGRLGRNFASPRGQGIYLSMLFRPQSIPRDTVSLTAWTAVAVSNAVARICCAQPGIKWVNDLVMNSKKVCGILTEMSIESESSHIQFMIIGIGVNVKGSGSSFPADIRHVATTLENETGVCVVRARLAAEMIRELDQMCAGWPHQSKTYLEAYRANCITVGKEVSVHVGAGQRAGVALSINDDFSLHVGFADGTMEDLASGEVSVRGMYGYV